MRGGGALAAAAVALFLAGPSSPYPRVATYADALAQHSSPVLPSSRSRSVLPRDRPCVGVASRGDDGGGPRVEYTIIGTSHFRCNSADEVRSLIDDVRPDGVVVELDPERVIRLTKEGIKSAGVEQPFGADFLAAIDASRTLDIPLFIGDEYTKETRSRLVRTALSPETYGPGRLMTVFFPRMMRGDAPSSSRPIDLLGTFISDPMKLVPPLAAVSPALLLVLATMPEFHPDDVGGNVTTLLALALSFLATCKVFNTFIADRDDVLALNAVRAADAIASLKRGETVRKRWEFTVKTPPIQDKNGQSQRAGESLTPIFTLKTPLETGKVRNLNFFEPRWLKMIDGVRSRPLDSQTFGCVTCTNKFYSAANVNGQEGRYADIIFERRGTVAELTELKEGRRPVSGERKVSARIEGRDEFVVEDEETVSVSEDGYLLALNIVCDQDGCYAVESDRFWTWDGEEINILVVVGLLHANGVIERLSRD